MNQDQAHQLRQLSNSLSGHRRTSRVITVASGKGGVGKSNFILSFALSLMDLGQKVVVIDLDIGMANLDILMGATPKRHLLDMIRERKSIWSVLERGPKGLEYIAGGSGLSELLQLREEDRHYFFRELEKLHGYADLILIDTGAGLTAESQQCHLAADEVILLTTPEPTALADAYSVVKMLHSKSKTISFQLVVNRVSRQKEGVEVGSKFKFAVQRFLQKEITIFGAIPDDGAVMQAVLIQVPFYLAYPRSQVSLTLKRLAERFVTGAEAAVPENGGMKGFIRTISRLFIT
ncbi:MinD/ParA family protein [Neobacillus kokaensis]|uniref:Flagellum site-determining protein YlxH n=1 Tax=Neobacillus kokaensis TaxID=2759023 RepID=A0ABQ3N724_9BACI|nr:MinD/ParA family protein [Neobacillus kokaensis]GHH99964.1 flagellum site-determining protein YlxH [Neobacillus kokaensis]